MNTPATDAVIEACLAFARDFPGAPVREITLARNVWLQFVQENIGHIEGISAPPYIFASYRPQGPGTDPVVHSIKHRAAGSQGILPLQYCANEVRVCTVAIHAGIRFPSPTGYVLVKLDPVSADDILESLK